jgi:peptidoglycan/xylan/chitin deacetylase (PgdA/CDA1 family)
LTRCLSDPAVGVKAAAVLGLCSFGTNAMSALPALRSLADDRTDETVRRAARLAVVRVQCETRDGAIIRGPKDQKRIALVFTGHEFGEGGEVILNELARHKSRASFFLTGAFLTNSEFAFLVDGIQNEWHYIGPHSDRHLLYCAWEEPRRTLVNEDQFQEDLLANVVRIPGNPNENRRFARYFLPPFEHYNREIADWTRANGWTLINFTPGTRSNADYTGEADRNFASSQKIFNSIVAREHEDPDGLNGFILLLHIGAGPGRADKFHARFGELLDYLAGRGYEFVRVDELLRPPRDPSLTNAIPRPFR